MCHKNFIARKEMIGILWLVESVPYPVEETVYLVKVDPSVKVEEAFLLTRPVAPLP